MRGARFAFLSPAPFCYAPAMLSVVIITANRHHMLRRCLAGLDAQSPAIPHEIIVVDQASTDGTGEMLAREQQTHPNLRMDTLPDPSANAKRNRGASLARYDLIAFLDDDAVPDPGWLAALLDAFQNPAHGIVTGSLHPLTPGYGQTLRLAPAPRLWKPCFRNKLVVWRCGVSANMAVRRAAFNRLGGFDPVIGTGTPLGGCGDDVDFFLRALNADLPIYYSPAARVFHHQSDQPAEFYRRACAYHFGIAAMVRYKFARDPAALAMIPLRLGHSAVMGIGSLLACRPESARARGIEIKATLAGWRAGARARQAS